MTPAKLRDPRDSPFQRTVTRADVENAARQKPSAQTVERLREGLRQALEKQGYNRGKRLEPGTSAEDIAYHAEREASVTDTVEFAQRELKRHETSVAASERRRERGFTAFARLTDAFLQSKLYADEHAFLSHLAELAGNGLIRLERHKLDKGADRFICADGSSVYRRNVKFHLHRSRERLDIEK